MIIGRGDLAKAITDRDGFIFYCNGASTRKPFSKEIDEILALAKEQGKDNRMFVYFGSLSIYYSNNKYSEFKKSMEDIIRDNFEDYAIVRIGNITFGNNPNTIINFLKNKINNNEPYEVRDETRYLISQEELNHWISLIPRHGKHEMNITGERVSIQEIVSRINNNLL